MVISSLFSNLISIAVILVFIWNVFFAIYKLDNSDEEKMNEEHFIVMYPKIYAVIGIVGNSMLTIIIVGFTLSQQISDIITAIIFYSVFGLFFLGGLYLVLKTVKYKVILTGKEILVSSIFEKPYTFLISDIVSAVREEKITHYGERERTVIKTKEGRKIIVENSQISYERLLRKIESNVNKECMVGFENREENDCSLINIRIIELIKLFASTPELQLSLFPDKIEEIVNTFDSWLLIYENDTVSRYRYFSKNEYRLILDLNRLLNSFDDEQLTEYAIRTSEKWGEVRLRARDVLSTLGIEYCVPERYRDLLES